MEQLFAVVLLVVLNALTIWSIWGISFPAWGPPKMRPSSKVYRVLGIVFLVFEVALFGGGLLFLVLARR